MKPTTLRDWKIEALCTRIGQYLYQGKPVGPFVRELRRRKLGPMMGELRLRVLQRLRVRLATLQLSQQTLRGVNDVWKALGKPKADDELAWSRIAARLLVNVGDLQHIRREYAAAGPKSRPVPDEILQANHDRIVAIQKRILALGKTL